MKRSFLLSLLGVLIAILAAVLVLRRANVDPVAPDSANNTPPATASEDLDHKVAKDEEATSQSLMKSNRELDPEPGTPEETAKEESLQKSMMEQLSETITKQHEAKADKLIAKLVKDLNLTPAQKAALEKHFAKQVALAGGLLTGAVDELDAMASLKAIQQLDGKGMDELMAEVLSPEQKEQWDTFSKEQKHRRADSGALKQFANLNSVIEIREDQRDAVYDHFYNKQLAAEDDDSLTGAVTAMIGGVTGGLDNEANLSGLSSTDFSAIGQAAAANDGGEIDYREVLRQQRKQNIDNQINELAPILDEEQLTDYRNHLESQGSFIEGISPEVGNFSENGPSQIEIERVVLPVPSIPTEGQ